MTCLNQIRLKTETGHRFVPCGRCLFCLQARAEAWAIRLTEELKRSKSAYFVTLTYNDEHYPGKIDKSQIQAFLKRLRHFDKKWYNISTQSEIGGFPVGINVSEAKFKYYIVGEYGTKNDRGHYHCIFFNLHPFTVAKIDQVWSVPYKGKEESLGFVSVGTVTEKSIYYTLKYFINEDRKRTFAIMSKGIGITYADKLKEYHRLSEVGYYRHPGNKLSVLPRYYKDKIFTPGEKATLAYMSQLRIAEKEKKNMDHSARRGDHYFTVLQSNIENKRRKLQTKKTRSL